MRILSIGSMYPPHSLGGYEVIWRSNTEHLRRCGHEVRILTTDYIDPTVERTSELDVHRQLSWYWRDHDFPRLGYFQRLRLERQNRDWLNKHLDEFRPDAVAWWAMGGMSLSLVEQCRRRGTPAVGVVCDDWMLYGPKMDQWTRAFLSRPRLGALVERITSLPTRLDLGGAGSWVFISDFCRHNARRFADELPQTRIAHAGVSAKRFRPGPDRPWSGRLLYAGRIDPRKGIATAVAALAELPASMRLDVVGSGDGNHIAELKELADRQGVLERTFFAPAVSHDELRTLYTGADAVLFPVAWPEPWGLVPLEAMACGTPVIATGTGGSGEYLRHEQNCLRFGPEDPSELAAAVQRLASSETLRRALREGGLATARLYTDERFNETVRNELESAGSTHK